MAPTAPKSNPRIDFNLETAEKENVREPFRPYIPSTSGIEGDEGRVLTMTDPSDIDWQDLLEIENPAQFLRYCISGEDREWLLKQPMPGWQFGKLIEAYQRHYGLGGRGNAAASRI